MRYLLLALAGLPAAVLGATQWDAFLDTYYGYDSSAPRSAERSFTTQALRHNEPNVNLAMIGGRVEEKNFRGKLTLHGGNSVEANTIEETSDLKYLQEAFAGARAGEVWFDGGIFLGHIGAESWISRDNWTYTRALGSEYTPYYETGLRASWKKFQFFILNGWQNIRETNGAKSLGLSWAHAFSPRLHFTYNNFFGDEEVVSARSRFRAYHNFILKYLPSQTWNYLLTWDLGHQSQQRNDGVDLWWTVALTVRRVISADRAWALRLEHYADPHEANVLTSGGAGFVTSSVSLNFDQRLGERLWWRTEVRGYEARDRLFPEGRRGLRKTDGLLVTSLSISLF